MGARDQRSDEAVAELLLDQLAIMRSNIDGVIVGDDPDPLHDLRVALRRSRSVLKGMPGVFLPEDLERFKSEFKELQTITGPVRDYDVLLEDLDSFAVERTELTGDVNALRKELARSRNAARTKLKRRLKSKRFLDLLDSWQASLESLPAADEAERPDAGTTIAELGQARISADRKRFKELGRAALESEDPAAAHHTRKRGKALRYNLEFFGHFGDKKRAKKLGRRLKKIQDDLGAYQDTIAHEAVLREAAESADSIAAAVAAGALIERALDEREFRLEEFRRRFAKFLKH